MSGEDKPIRFVLTQPAQPKYRVPVFRELASRPGIRLKLVYAEDPGIANVPAEGYDAEEWPVRRFDVRGQTLWWHSAQLHFASRRRADVVGMTWNTRYLSLVPALLLARLRGVGTVVWGHGFSKRESPRRFALRVRVARLATAVLLYNHTAAERVIAAGLPRERVFVALNALDQGPIQAAREEWVRDPARLAAFRQREGLDRGPVVLFVSRLEEANRVDLMLEAVAKLRERVPGITAAVVGRGPELERLKALAASLGLGERAKFPGAIYDEAQLAAWFASADVFCYPSNIGLSLVHALGYGLPVVTGDNVAAQNPEIEALEPGVNGLLYRDGDAGDLAETLARLLQDRALRESMSEAARRTVVERFTLRRMVDGMEAAARFAAARARSPR